MRRRQPRGRQPRSPPRKRPVVLLDTGPLLERAAEELDAGCASSPGLRELLAKAGKLVARAEYVATVCPVYVEALHLLNSRCKGRLRGEALDAARSRLAHMLASIRDAEFDLRESLRLVIDAPWLDLADAALILAAEKLGRDVPVVLLTVDSRLASLARRRKVQAFTLWELASLLGEV